MIKICKILVFVILCYIPSNNLYSNPVEFNQWLKDFKKTALKNGISKETIDLSLKNCTFLPNVIKYDRYQPEFYEDTLTYINKRVNKKKLKQGKILYNQKKNIIDNVEKNYSVEKELLLALMGIETNFGNYLGKMDIISSLATLSFDKRRSDFFTNELIILLKLIDNKKVDPNILFGSWAGAFGNFQFMPSTINSYAVDSDKNYKIELKKIEDSFASAANYISSIGWSKNEPCFYKVDLTDNIPKKYLNSSAKKINNKKKFKFFKKYIKNSKKYKISDDQLTGIIIPDKDIVEGSKSLEPAYLVFNNYELILKWNRSLRFALAVCTLKDNFKNEI